MAIARSLRQLETTNQRPRATLARTSQATRWLMYVCDDSLVCLVRSLAHWLAGRPVQRHVLLHILCVVATQQCSLSRALSRSLLASLLVRSNALHHQTQRPPSKHTTPNQHTHQAAAGKRQEEQRSETQRTSVDSGGEEAKGLNDRARRTSTKINACVGEKIQPPHNPQGHSCPGTSPLILGFDSRRRRDIHQNPSSNQNPSSSIYLDRDLLRDCGIPLVARC